ncbi:MAG: LruC domain-containing protein [Phocaeicola sp.]
MKKIFHFAVVGLILSATACTDNIENIYDPQIEREHSDFDFSMVAKGVKLSVSYQNMGFKAPVYFELYDVEPVTYNEESGAYTKKEGLLPLYADYTDGDGTFAKTLDLPSYLSKVYIFSPSFYATTLMEATCSNGSIVATDLFDSNTAASVAAARAGSTSAIYRTVTIQSDNWKPWLGEFNESTGEITAFVASNSSTQHPGYAYTAANAGSDYKPELVPSNFAALYTAHSAVINISKTCPEEYRSYSDMNVSEDAEVVLTGLGGNTCWNSSMGYYYYPQNEPPTSYEDIKSRVILLFPNTQDGKWSRNISEATRTKGLNRGTSVQLMYYPNIANGDRSGATKVFPKGTKIGFVLACNAWTNRISGFTSTKNYRAATSSGLSRNNNNAPINKPRTAIYKYDDWVMMSFEDHTDDENFSDVVFTLKSDPVDAITDIPVYDKETQIFEVTTNRGIYAFEDMWPSEGDYDMNDVLIRSNYKKIYRTIINLTNGVETSRTYKLLSETFEFKTFQNYATLVNGFAFRAIKGNAMNASTIRFTKKIPTSDTFVEYNPVGDGGGAFTNYSTKYPNQPKDLFVLTDNLANKNGVGFNPDPVGTIYRAEFIYGTVDNVDSGISIVLSTNYESDIQTFVMRTCDEGNLSYRLEIHIPYEAPTLSSRMLDDNSTSIPFTTLWNHESDASNPFSASPSYYLRALKGASVKYPFAFFLAGATEADLAGLLDPNNESKKISTLYTQYNDWVLSGGTTHKDWYK